MTSQDDMPKKFETIDEAMNELRGRYRVWIREGADAIHKIYQDGEDAAKDYIEKSVTKIFDPMEAPRCMSAQGADSISHGAQTVFKDYVEEHLKEHTLNEGNHLP
jgi:hypothetical protein